MTTGDPPQQSPVKTRANAPLAFLSVLLAVAATAVESTAVSVSLPSLSSYFSASASSATWVIAIAQFVIVALLLPIGVLGEVMGYKRIYLISLGVHSVATLACILAPNFESLMLARGAQAVGIAGVMSLSFAMMRTIFSDEGLGSAIGFVVATVAISSSGGPAIAGVILSIGDWRGAFALMFLMSAVSLVTAWFVLPDTKGSGKRFDFSRAALLVLTLASALCLINGFAYDWSGRLLEVAAVVSAVGLWLVIVTSRGKPSPIFPLDLLAIAPFSLSICASVCVFTSQAIGFLILPFYLYGIVGFSELKMALVLSTWPLATALFAPILGKLTDRVPAGPMGALGLLVLALGFVLTAQLGAGSTATVFAICLALCGFGFALCQTPNNRLIMLSSPRERSGAASASLSLARQSGRAVGTAIAATALAVGASSLTLNILYLAAALAIIGMCFSLARTTELMQ